eukprot:319389_1
MGSVCCACCNHPDPVQHDKINGNDGAINKHSTHDHTSSPFSYVPSIALQNSRNGVVTLQITNLLKVSNGPKEFNEWKHWNFEFCYKYIHNSLLDQSQETSANKQWKTATFTPYKVTSDGMFVIKNKLYLYDYQIHCKVRAIHQNCSTIFPYSSVSTIDILSSLIESTFHVDEYVNYVQENATYTKEGFIDEVLEDSFLSIRCIDDQSKKITIHSSRVYSAPIYLDTITIDLSNRIEVDQNLLILNHIDDRNTIAVFSVLNDIYAKYALDYHVSEYETVRECNAVYIGKVVAKNTIDFLFKPYYKVPKISCLVREPDGWIVIEPYTQHTLRRYIDSVKSGANDVNDVNLQDLYAYCDICSVEISRYDWAASCNIDVVHNDHIMCLTCVNNVLEQKEQLYQLLNELMNGYLYNDCIEQVVEFVVGRVVSHEPI